MPISRLVFYCGSEKLNSLPPLMTFIVVAIVCIKFDVVSFYIHKTTLTC